MNRCKRTARLHQTREALVTERLTLIEEFPKEDPFGRSLPWMPTTAQIAEAHEAASLRMLPAERRRHI